MCRTRISVNQTLARPEWDPQLLEPSHKRTGDEWSQDRRLAGAWKVDQRPVFGDDAIDEVEIAGDAAEVIENAAGDEDHGDIAPPRIGDGIEYGWGRAVVAGDRAVVVQRQD